MDGQHADAKLGGRADGAGNGVGDVVELQVQKDFTAGGDELPDELRAFGRKQLLANFVGGGRVADALD